MNINGTRILSREPSIMPTGCWQLPHKPSSHGYVILGTGRGGGRVLAHRLFYEAANGPIPPGLVIDHLCRNRLCVNPAHLEAVTEQINILRGNGPTAANAQKTHCPRGHEFSGHNLKLVKGGSRRRCAACHRIEATARYRRIHHG